MNVVDQAVIDKATTEATSWSHLHDLLFEDSWNDGINRFRSTYAFRGMGSASHELRTSLIRLGKPYENMELNLIKQFQKYAQKHVVDMHSEWDWLSIAQHHGLPTRLLDWTYSPFVALHFATCDSEKSSRDGVVWMVDFADAHKLLQDSERDVLKRYGANIFSMDMLRESFPTGLDSFDRRHSRQFDCVLFFEPPAFDDRIINQFAYFSVLSDPTLPMDDWLTRRDVAGQVKFKKIVIPAKLKREVRDKLDQVNQNERILMGGLDGLCAWLKRHYTPMGKP